MRNLIVVLFAVLTLSASGRAAAQGEKDSLSPKKIALRDGSEIFGTIVRTDSAMVQFKTSSGIMMEIPRREIKKIDTLSGEFVDGEYHRFDPNRTRLFFAPTARPLGAGQGYFSAYEIFFPFLAVGVSDFLTLAGGISLLPGADEQILYFAPKVTPLHLKAIDVSAGVLYLTSTGGNGDGVGIMYGVTTIGSPRASATIGLGWGFHGEDISDQPIVMLGGELQVSNSVKLITENWIPPSSDVAMVSFGIRFFGEHLAADLGLIHPAGARMEGFPFIPWIGFTYNF